MSNPSNEPLRLGDGRDVLNTLAAAEELGVATSYLPSLAKREGLTRFAKRNEKGAPSFFWLLTELEDLKARRTDVVVNLPSDEIVPLPYENEQG